GSRSRGSRRRRAGWWAAEGPRAAAATRRGRNRPPAGQAWSGPGSSGWRLPGGLGACLVLLLRGVLTGYPRVHGTDGGAAAPGRGRAGGRPAPTGVAVGPAPAAGGRGAPGA